MKILKQIKEIVETETIYTVDKYCCDKMKKALTHGDYDSERAIRIDKNKKQLKLHCYCGDNSSYKDNYYEYLDFCPFCGQKVE